MSVNFANNNSLSAITALPTAISGGSLNLISTSTASSSATLSFTSGIDSTYKEYIFKFINMHPATDGATFQFNGSVDSGSNYNVTKTTTSFFAFHLEDGSDEQLGYSTSNDLAQSTSFQNLADSVGNDNDQSASGFLHLFDPSNTTFVKHFINTGVHSMNDDRVLNRRQAGYFNTTSAIDAVQFKFSSGNIDSGVIKLYGVS
tara:strand:- start:4 stop:609 length:606 start_codon:yes stop_codon:yes gene_type:complete